MTAEDHLDDAQRATVMASEEWHGPVEAETHLMWALGHLAYADYLWRTMEDRR